MRRSPWILVVALGGLLIGGMAACNSSPSAPTTQPPSLNAPPPGDLVLNGRVVGTLTGEPIAGATVTVGSDTFVTDRDGAFFLTNVSADTNEISISGEGVVPRVSRLSPGDRDITVDVIQDRPPFELGFFRELGRNALESTTGLEPLRPIATAPRIYIRTVDEAGRQMDPALLDLIEAALGDAAPFWSAARHPLQVVERGPNTRLGQSGWVTVIFPGEVVSGGGCGKATLGSATGRMELNYLNGGCACSGNVIAPRTVRHELGHVYGFWHTTARGGVMSRTWTTRQCNGRPSTREIEHAKYMYSRMSGNVDPDSDTAGRLLGEPGEIVVED